jgi:hypothetical protein
VAGSRFPSAGTLLEALTVAFTLLTYGYVHCNYLGVSYSMLVSLIANLGSEFLHIESHNNEAGGFWIKS